MKEIELTQGRFTLIDNIDLDYLNQWKWYYREGYAVRTDRTEKRQRTIWMHRVVLERMGHVKFKDSDHKNGNSLDNRRFNLRPTTHAQNSFNQKLPKNNISGFKGVSYYPKTKNWRACIAFGGKQIHLGYFTNKLKAARAYNKAAKKYYKEFARLNKCTM